MNNKRIMVLLLTLALLPSTIAFAGGDGTQGDPYQIATLEQLNQTRENLTAHYVLINDIDATNTSNWNSGEGWEPIGPSPDEFTGTFDGLYNTIDGLFIDNSATNQGLFSIVGSEGEVTNIFLTNLNITAHSAGGIASINNGLVSGVKVQGTITATTGSAGGIVRENNQEISQAIAEITIAGSGNGMGGISSTNSGSITNTRSSGKVLSEGSSSAGGIAGRNEGTVLESYSSANVSSPDYLVAGLIGWSLAEGSVRNSFSLGAISGNFEGGVVGYNEGSANSLFFHNTPDNPSSCAAFGTASCNIIDEADHPPYFFNESKEPMASWGDEWFFSNSSLPELLFTKKPPIVQVLSVENITDSSANVTVKLKNLGNFSTAEVGVRYDLAGTVEDIFVQNFTSPDMFSLTLNLSSGVSYDVSAIVRIPQGIVQSNEISFTTNGTFDFEGEGTEENPFIITNAFELQQIKSNLSAYYKLANDIDASGTAGWNNGAGFEPIAPDYEDPFTGTLDGGFHRISDLHVDTGSGFEGESAGIFDEVSEATIKNLQIIDANFKGSDGSGILAGRASNSLLEKIFVSGTITTTRDGIGGLVGGQNGGVISQVGVDVDIFSADDTVGGLAGSAGGIIINSFSKGDVDSNRYTSSFVGGFSVPIIINSYTSGTLQGNPSQSGGLASRYSSDDGIMINSFSADEGEPLIYNPGTTSTLINNYYLNTSSNSNNCFGYLPPGSQASCIGIDENDHPPYFFNMSNEPMASWDYTVWHATNETTDYPQLIWMLPSRIETLEPTNTTNTSITLQANATLENVASANVKFEWGAEFIGEKNTTSTISMTDNGSVSITLNDLTPGRAYFARAILENETIGKRYGDTIFFRTNGTFFNNGTGNSTEPFIITNFEEFQHIKYNTNSDYSIGNDIDGFFSSEYSPDWRSTNGIGFIADEFSGTLNGNNYSIRNIVINESIFPQTIEALFTTLTNSAFITNINFTNITLQTTDETSAIITSQNNGTIESIQVEGNLIGSPRSAVASTNKHIIRNSHVEMHMNNQVSSNRFGAIAGDNYGNITSNSVNGSFNITGSGGSSAAGSVVGYNYGLIDNATSTGDMISGASRSGGIAGRNEETGTIRNSQSYMVLEGTSSFNRIGGITGRNEGNISQSFTKNPSIKGILAGGIASENIGIIESSYSESKINSSNEAGGITSSNSGIVNNTYYAELVFGNNDVGGITGSNSGHILNSYASLKNMSGDYAGGIAGRNYGTINSSFAVGNISGNVAGGVIGEDDDGSINDVFYLDTENNPGVCSGTGETCTIIDSESYFHNYSNNPMNTWDFDVWSYIDAFTALPKLKFDQDLEFEIVDGDIISLTPGTINDFDPAATIQVTTKVFSFSNTVANATFEWKNATSAWNESEAITMINSSPLESRNEFVLNFTLPAFENNLTIRVRGQDNKGNTVLTQERPVPLFWECNWELSPQAPGPFAGIAQTKELFELNLKNTGDVNFSNGCVLDFTLTHNLPTGKIIYDNETFKNVKLYSLNPKEETNISIDASFSADVIEEEATISLVEQRGFSDRDSRNTTFLLVSSSENPYLFPEITEAPVTIPLREQTFNINASVQNLLGSEHPAFNVSTVWSTPPGTSANTSEQVEPEINSSARLSRDLSVSLTKGSLPSAQQGLQEFTLSASGVNASGEPILHENNNTEQTASVSVLFECYEQSDNVCVASCGFGVDPDCPQPTESVGGGGGGGGSGGSGGGGGSSFTPEQRERLFSSEELLEVVRGDNRTYSMKIENPVNHSLRGISFSLEGFLAQYLSISPVRIEELGPQESVAINISFRAPEYFSEQEYNLSFTLEGTLIEENTETRGNATIRSVKETKVKEIKSLQLLIHEVAPEIASNYTKESRTIVNGLREGGFRTAKTEDILQRIITAYENKEYSLVEELSRELDTSVKQAHEAKAIIGNVERDVEESLRKGIETPKTNRLLSLAGISLEREEFSTALSRSRDAETTFIIETQGKFNALVFLQNNWERISVGIFIAILIIWQGILIMKYLWYSAMLIRLRSEEDILFELMKEVQRETFEKNKLSMDEYLTTLTHYEEKLGKNIIRTIAIESKKSKVFSFFKTHYQSLLEEKEKILQFMKNSQELYLNGGKIESLIYQHRIKNYSERLAEIDESIAQKEANKHIKQTLKAPSKA